MNPSPDTTKSARARAGFTMVELMVSISILALLIVMLTTIFNVSMQSWQRSEGGNERRRGGRSMTDFIGNELRGAMIPITGSAPLSEKGDRIANLQLIINPPQVGAANREGDTIFWQAPLATEKTFGDVAELGYFVKWIPTTSGSRPTLCRFFVNPSMTDTENGGVAQNPLFQIYGTRGSGGSTTFTNIDGWLSDSILQQAAPANEVNGYRGLFLENVLGLWIRAYGIDGTELPRVYSSRVYDNQIGDIITTGPKQESGVTSGYVVTSGSTGNTRYAEVKYLPSMIKVSIAQVDGKHALRLDAAEVGIKAIVGSPDVRDATDFFSKVTEAAKESGALRAILPGVRIYSTDVPLENAR